MNKRDNDKLKSLKKEGLAQKIAKVEIKVQLVPKKDFHPRDYQQEIIEESCKYFEKNDKGLFTKM